MNNIADSILRSGKQQYYTWIVRDHPQCCAY